MYSHQGCPGWAEEVHEKCPGKGRTRRARSWPPRGCTARERRCTVKKNMGRLHREKAEKKLPTRRVIPNPENSARSKIPPFAGFERKRVKPGRGGERISRDVLLTPSTGLPLPCAARDLTLQCLAVFYFPAFYM